MTFEELAVRSEHMWYWGVVLYGNWEGRGPKALRLATPKEDRDLAEFHEIRVRAGIVYGKRS
jgi:hypothetical protein